MYLQASPFNYEKKTREKFHLYLHLEGEGNMQFVEASNYSAAFST